MRGGGQIRRRGLVMPIRFRPDGTFEFDSPEEAVAFRNQIAKQSQDTITNGTAAATPGKRTGTRVNATPSLLPPEAIRDREVVLDTTVLLAYVSSLGPNATAII